MCALSAGERQRVAIARALDEPTTNLDSEHGREVMELLRTLTRSKGNGALVVSHDPRLEEAADRVLRLRDGRLSRAETAAHAGVTQ